MNNQDHINGWRPKLEQCELETSINHIVALILYPLLCVVCDFVFLPIPSLCHYDRGYTCRSEEEDDNSPHRRELQQHLELKAVV